MGNVCVLSSTNLDVRFTTSDLPTDWGMEIYVDDIHVELGGKGFNMAQAAAWLGADVVLCTPQGNDNDAGVVMSRVESARRAIEETPKEQVSSGKSHSAPGSLRTAYQPSTGATGLVGAFTSSTRAPTYLTRRRRVHWESLQILPAAWHDEIAAADVLLLSLEPPLELVAAAIEAASDHGTRVVLNGGPPARDETEKAEAARLVQAVDGLILDWAEALRLTFEGGDNPQPDDVLADIQRRYPAPFDVLCLTGKRSAAYHAMIATGVGDVTRVPDASLKPAGERAGTNSTLCAAVAVAMALGQSSSWCLEFAVAATTLFTGKGKIRLHDIYDLMGRTTRP